jgi:hypothetical protein
MLKMACVLIWLKPSTHVLLYASGFRSLKIWPPHRLTHPKGRVPVRNCGPGYPSRGCSFGPRTLLQAI